MTAGADWSQLMAHAQEGDRDHYSLLLKEVAHYVRSYLTTKVRDAEHVEDIVQEVLLTIHRVRHTFDPGRPFKPWLHAIVQSRLVEHWRRYSRRQSNEKAFEDFEMDLIQAEEEISHVEVEALNYAMKSLSSNQQKVIRLLKIEGFSIKETAEQMGMSESAVKVTAHRGYKKLFESLRQ